VYSIENTRSREESILMILSITNASEKVNTYSAIFLPDADAAKIKELLLI